MVPSILLSATDKVLMEGMFDIVEGNIPVSLFPSTKKYSNLVNEPNEVGTVPVRAFRLISMAVMVAAEAKFPGMVPTNLLSFRQSPFSFVNSAI